jgi:hypothetical protein
METSGRTIMEDVIEEVDEATELRSTNDERILFSSSETE